MGVNSLTFQHCSTVLTSLYKQASGRDVVVSTTPDFISVASATLSLGTDAVMNALSNVLARTIFSVRPYSAKLKGLEMSADRFGLMTRKLSPVVKDPGDDAAYLWPVAYDAGQSPATGDGHSVDMYAISKKQVLQTGFAGAAVYQEIFTIFKDQLDGAFQSPSEFMAFNVQPEVKDWFGK